MYEKMGVTSPSYTNETENVPLIKDGNRHGIRFSNRDRHGIDTNFNVLLKFTHTDHTVKPIVLRRR